MPFHIEKVSETAEWYEARETLWLTADRERVVHDGDPDAAFLFASEGKRISVEDVARYGLTGKAARKTKAEADAADERTIKELQAEAKELGLTGVSKLSTAELAAALEEAKGNV